MRPILSPPRLSATTPRQIVARASAGSRSPRLVDGGVSDAGDGSRSDELEHVEIDESMTGSLPHTGDEGSRLDPIAITDQTEQLNAALDVDPRPESHVRRQDGVGEPQQPAGMGQMLIPEQGQRLADIVQVFAGSLRDEGRLDAAERRAGQGLR